MQRQSEELFQYAVGLLARREHASFELQQKFKQKFPSTDSALYAKVLERLIELGYQSDERYTNMLVRAKVSRGYGPRYISQYLNSRKISRELIQEALAPFAYDWLDLAIEQAKKKFSCEKMVENQSKCIRFLLGRGYDPDIAQKAVKESLKSYHEESYTDRT